MPRTITPQEAEYLDILKTLSPDEQQVLMQAIKNLEDSKNTYSLPEDDLINQLVGHTFTEEERLKLEIESMVTYFRHRRQLLKDALTTSDVADLLGTSRQTPHDRVKGKTLLGVLDNGMLRFPRWQFDPEGPNGVIEGLPEILKALKISDFAKLNWLMSPNPILDGITPVAVLKQGQKDRVLAEAIGIGEN